MYVLLYHVDDGSALHGIQNCTANTGAIHVVHMAQCGPSEICLKHFIHTVCEC